MIRYLLFLAIIANILQAKHLNKEKVYQQYFCDKFGGITEYRLHDQTRVDCLSKEYAFEVDFAQKWAESVGQSLYYASETSKQAAVLLIMEDIPKDTKYLHRLKKVSRQHKIDIWTIDKAFNIHKSSEL